jgi:hypothetical protein
MCMYVYIYIYISYKCGHELRNTKWRAAWSPRLANPYLTLVVKKTWLYCAKICKLRILSWLGLLLRANGRKKSIGSVFKGQEVYRSHLQGSRSLSVPSSRVKKSIGPIFKGQEVYLSHLQGSRSLSVPSSRVKKSIGPIFKCQEVYRSHLQGSRSLSGPSSRVKKSIGPICCSRWELLL